MFRKQWDRVNTIIGFIIYFVGGGFTAGFICHMWYDDDWEDFFQGIGPTFSTIVWPLVLPCILPATATLRFFKYLRMKKERKLAAAKEIELIMKDELADV